MILFRYGVGVKDNRNFLLHDRGSLPAKGTRERSERLGLSPKILSGANAFEIIDIERMNIGAHRLGV
jgi:hypothetical protein